MANLCRTILRINFSTKNETYEFYEKLNDLCTECPMLSSICDICDIEKDKGHHYLKSEVSDITYDDFNVYVEVHSAWHPALWYWKKIIDKYASTATLFYRSEIPTSMGSYETNDPDYINTCYIDYWGDDDEILDTIIIDKCDAFDVVRVLQQLLKTNSTDENELISQCNSDITKTMCMVRTWIYVPIEENY